MPITEVQIPGTVSDERKTTLVGYLAEKYKEAYEARSTQVDSDYQRWINNYEAIPKNKKRNFPFTNASNLVIPLGQIHCDILEARLLGFLYAVHPFFTIRTWPPMDKYEWQAALSRWLDFKMNYVWMWVPQIRSILGRTLRGGTCTAKLTHAVREYISVKPGTEGQQFIETEVKQDTLYLDPIPFRCFSPYPFRANTLRDVQICFHTLQFTREEVEWRRDKNIWDPVNAGKLLSGPPKERTQTELQTETSAGTEPQRPQTPFEAVEAHLDYDLGGGKRHQLIITFEPLQKLWLKGIYNNIPRGERSFVDFRLFPRDDSYFAYSLMQRMEMFQEETSSIHNNRANSNMISGIPGWKKKRYADVPNPSTEWYPGKVFELENMDDLDILQFQRDYVDLIQEENQSLQLAERVSGVSPPMQGFGAGVMQGKRGIYNAAGTLAMLQEGNRRVDVYLKDLRYGFSRVGKLSYLMLRSAGVDPSEYNGYDELKLALAAAEKAEVENLFFEITASSSSTNREADRTAYLMMTQVLQLYYTSIIQAATQVSQLQVSAPGHPLVQLFMAILEGAHDVASHLLDAFDYSDKRKALPNAREILLRQAAQGGPNALPQLEPGGNPAAEAGLGESDIPRIAEMLAGISQGTEFAAPAGRLQ